MVRHLSTKRVSWGLETFCEIQKKNAKNQSNEIHSKTTLAEWNLFSKLSQIINLVCSLKNWPNQINDKWNFHPNQSKRILISFNSILKIFKKRTTQKKLLAIAVHRLHYLRYFQGSFKCSQFIIDCPKIIANEHFCSWLPYLAGARTWTICQFRCSFMRSPRNERYEKEKSFHSSDFSANFTGCSRFCVAFLIWKLIWINVIL